MPPTTPTPSYMPPVQTPPVPTPPPVVPLQRPTPPSVVPPTPPTPPQPSGDHKEVRVILPALLLVLILGALYYWYQSRTPSYAPSAPPTVTNPQPNITVSQTNVAQASTPAGKLPAGFPTEIPVEAANIKESYIVAYASQNVTQYTVSYTSSKSKDTLWNLYNALTLKGYTLNTTSTNKAQGVLDLKKGIVDELNVLIVPQGAGQVVHLTYLSRG